MVILRIPDVSALMCKSLAPPHFLRVAQGHNSKDTNQDKKSTVCYNCKSSDHYVHLCQESISLLYFKTLSNILKNAKLYKAVSFLTEITLFTSMTLANYTDFTYESAFFFFLLCLQSSILNAERYYIKGNYKEIESSYRKICMKASVQQHSRKQCFQKGLDFKNLSCSIIIW